MCHCHCYETGDFVHTLLQISRRSRRCRTVEWVLPAGFFLWSIAETGTSLVKGFGGLLVLQLMLGMGESVAYPCYSKILAEHFAEHQRGFANACIDAGAKCGPALGTLAGGLFMAHFGWRPIFLVLGLGSLIWLPLDRKSTRL